MKLFLALMCAVVLSFPLLAQTRDPLTEKETDDLREVAQEPLKRMKLLIKFATLRLETVERIQEEPKVSDRGQKMHDALVDFRQIVDEIDDNVDDYSKKQNDLRKALSELVPAEEGFQSRLEGIKRVSEDSKNAAILKSYSFALQDALESVSLSLEDARKTLEEQNQALSTKKK